MTNIYFVKFYYWCFKCFALVQRITDAKHCLLLSKENEIFRLRFYLRHLHFILNFDLDGKICGIEIYASHFLGVRKNNVVTEPRRKHHNSIST